MRPAHGTDLDAEHRLETSTPPPPAAVATPSRVARRATDRRGAAAMALLGLPPPCCPPRPRHAPRPAAARSRRATSLRVAAGPTAAPTDAALPTPRPPEAVERKRRCDSYDLHQRIVPCADSLGWQESIAARRTELLDRDEDGSDTLIALQHSPIYTLGSKSSTEFLHFDLDDPPLEVRPIKRGGEVTYHGPGQLVLSLEEVIIRALKSAFSIKASRVQDLTGVWVGDEKVAFIGLHSSSRWIVYHGISLNVTTDLTPFGVIDPCGIKDLKVGSIKEILQKESGAKEISDTLLMDMTYNSIIKEFAKVFNLSLDLRRPDWSFQGNNRKS
ncbi:hypothetical protein ACP70R_033369 [Stipagrostis hirtigluma subsp. patula]